MPSYPKYAAALEWSVVVPLMGLIAAVNPYRNKTQAAIATVHAAAVAVACIGIATGTHVVIVAAIAVAAIAGVFTLYRINGAEPNHVPAELKILETLSPVSYALAYPLIFTPMSRIDRPAGVFLFVAHLVTIPLIAILLWSKELHDAWGCYGSQASLSDYSKGMCGQWNVDSIQICRDLQRTDPTNVDCTSDTTPFEFFGVLFHRVVQLQLISLTVWVHLMVLQYYESARALQSKMQ
ncbi:MAG: hypothetical protein CL678_00445 [Bdellovibrionaceae bacterium]|nr:hypothetical protein [Pseudobdellovibrionaceae bacterium]